MAYLGIDLGTSGVRVLLIDELGVPVGSAERHIVMVSPHSGWSEQNPKDWIDAVDDAMNDLRETHPEFRAVKGIGVSGQMHGAVLLDENDNVIRPCILWNDTRSHLEACELDASPGVRDISGNIVFPGFTAPKLEWLRKHELDNFAETHKVLLPASYFNWHLTGDYVADMSDGAGTAWLDVRARDWSDTLLDAGHMRRDQMPRLVEGSQVGGLLREELKQRWGLTGRVIVAGGAGDNAASACGIGALDEGSGFVSLGTSGVLLLARNGCYPAPETALHTFCHAVPERWYQMGVMLSATGSLSWLSRVSGTTPKELTSVLGDVLQPPGTVRFLPYLSGERTPHNDAVVRGAFTGLGNETSIVDMTRAVLEGVAFGLRDSAEAMRSVGAEIKTLYAIGGGTASRYWVQLVASVLQVPLLVPQQGEFGAALGAARLALVATTGVDPEEVMRPPEQVELIQPVSSLLDEFQDAYSDFKAAYPAIRSVQ